MKLITIIVSILLVGLPLGGVGWGYGSGIGWLAILLPLAIWCGTLPFMIRGYVVTSRQLRIVRLGWASVYSLEKLQSASFDPNAMSRSLRIFGNGGLFCISGLFKNRKLGRYRAFVTDPNHTVVLRFEHQTVVVSPERPEEFAHTLTRRFLRKES